MFSKQASSAFGYALLSFVIMGGIIGILYPFMAIVIIEAHGISKPLDASLTSFVDTTTPDDIVCRAAVVCYHRFYFAIADTRNLAASNELPYLLFLDPFFHWLDCYAVFRSDWTRHHPS